MHQSFFASSTHEGIARAPALALQFEDCDPRRCAATLQVVSCPAGMLRPRCSREQVCHCTVRYCRSASDMRAGNARRLLVHLCGSLMSASLWWA